MLCTATTAAGAPCKKNALIGADRCAFHVGPHIGQESQLTEELLDKLCQVLRTGCYLSVACRAVGIGTRTLRRWMAESGAQYDVLRERVERARSEGEVRNVAIISSHAQDNWQAAAWLLERQYPERWGRTSVRLRDPTDDDDTGENHEDKDPFAEVDELAEARRKRRLA